MPSHSTWPCDVKYKWHFALRLSSAVHDDRDSYNSANGCNMQVLYHWNTVTSVFYHTAIKYIQFDAFKTGTQWLCYVQDCTILQQITDSLLYYLGCI